MTKLKDILSPSFKDFRTPHLPMIQPTADSDFCQEVVARGWLTAEQMEHAAMRYRLGRSRSGKTIFWMIDDMMMVRDGRIGDHWVSQMLKAREPRLLQGVHTDHCLFGLHLLGHTEITETTEISKSHTDLSDFTDLYSHSCHAQPVPTALSVRSVESVCHIKTISVVESVQSCVVLSELFPKYLWMATGYLANLNHWLFLPLKGRRIVCYPATDPTGDTYLLWLNVATEARKFGLDITVSRFLEDHATPNQKSHRIDLIDFLYEK